MSVENKFALVAEFDNSISANIAQGLLQSHDIDAHVEGNIMSTMYAAGATWSPVELYVPADKLEEARRLLQEHGDI